MSLTDRAKTDWQRHTTNNNEWGVSISLETPDSSSQIDITGLATKHHIGIDTDGNLVNTKNAHISFSEQPLIDAAFAIRNADGEVDLEGFIVIWKDSTGGDKKYVINEWFPDETVGVIVCILGDYTAA